MIPSFLFGLACLCLALGHATMQHLLARERCIISVPEALLPRPSTLRWLWLPWLAVAAALATIAIAGPWQPGPASAWRLAALCAYAALPLVWYAVRLYRRVTVFEQRTVYVLHAATPGEIATPAALAAFYLLTVCALA
ncbi:MAG: hypothetical protein QM674_12835 [Burkholderiaceae bacterium]